LPPTAAGRLAQDGVRRQPARASGVVHGGHERHPRPAGGDEHHCGPVGGDPPAHVEGQRAHQVAGRALGRLDGTYATPADVAGAGGEGRRLLQDRPARSVASSFSTSRRRATVAATRSAPPPPAP
jgi:hypothetical protein